jgi:hypothetical protein
MMTDLLIRATIPADARWSYDDPSGVTEVTPKPDRRPARRHPARPVRPVRAA